MKLPPFEQVRDLFESSPVAVMMCDEERVRYANRACAELLGCPDAECVSLLHPVDDIAGPEHKEAYREGLARVMRGDAVLDQQWLRVRRQDGTEFHAHARSQPARYPDRLCVFVALVDVTQQREEQHRLDILRRAVDSISDAVLVMDRPGTILYANRAAALLFGAEGDQLIGTSAHRLVPEDAEIGEVTDLPGGSSDERHISVELSLRRLSGEVFPAGITMSIFQDADEDRSLSMVIVRDLTERKRLEAERDWREKQLGEMLREAHHRIKNNLQVASDVVALQAASTDSPEVSDALCSAATRIQALGAVHEGMSVDDDVTKVWARPLIETVVHNLRDSAALEGGAIRLTAEVERRQVSSREASALALIATELVADALRRMRSGSIRVCFTAAGGEATLEVIDDGPVHLERQGDQGQGFSRELVQLLTDEQLRGVFTLESSEEGTAACVRFPSATGDG